MAYRGPNPPVYGTVPCHCHRGRGQNFYCPYHAPPPTREDKCAHHWLLGDSHYEDVLEGDTHVATPGVCSKCGDTRTFRAPAVDPVRIDAGWRELRDIYQINPDYLHRLNKRRGAE